MHDPETVAFKNHWFTIWHVDPQIGGDEDSCDWFGDGKTRQNGRAPVVWDEYKMLTPDTQRAVDLMWWHWHGSLFPRPWWRHPRWHIRHWRFQVYFIQTVQRWLFTRCAGCGKRFAWGDAPISYSWDSPGPRWFHGEKSVYHSDCQPGAGGE